jgi:preprotein translocase subunit YajC
VLFAQENTAGGGNLLTTLGMFALLFGAMYFLFIRPQSKRRKEAEQMQKQIGAGDKVITIGGLYGTVASTDDDSVTLEIHPGVNARFSRQAIARVLDRAGGDIVAPDEVDHPADEPVSSAQDTKKKI